MLNPIEGEIFSVDKPLGWTSFEVVKKVRARLRKRLEINVETAEAAASVLPAVAPAMSGNHVY